MITIVGAGTGEIIPFYPTRGDNVWNWIWDKTTQTGYWKLMV